MQQTVDDKVKNMAISITGIVKAPSYITRSHAQKLMYRYISERMPDNIRSKEDFAKSQYRSTLKNRIRKGEKISAKEAIEVLGTKGYHRVLKDAKLDPFEETFKRLTLKEALNVYAIASDKERKVSEQILRGKYARSKNRTKDIKELFAELLPKKRR